MVDAAVGRHLDDAASPLERAVLRAVYHSPPSAVSGALRAPC